MADQKITDLSAAGALDGSELVELVQGGVNVKSTAQGIADLGGGTPTLGLIANTDVGTFSSISLGAATSLVAWFYLTKAINNANPIFLQDTSNAFAVYIGSSGSSGKIEVQKSSSAIARSTTNITRDAWHFLVITDDGAAIKIYLDGSDAGNSIGYTTFSGASLTRLNQGLNSSNFGGYLSEMAVFSRALNSGEVTTLWNSGAGVYGDVANAPFDSGLVAGWHLNDGIGVLVPDYSGNGKTVTLSDLGLWRGAPNIIVP